MRAITTSWDDGHELDGRLAELLWKYNLKATFYVPRKNAERRVMSPSAIRDLSARFEIGGHTLNHVRLHSTNKKILVEEINGCRNWIADLVDKEPRSFCFPGSVFTPQALKVVYACGFKVARTTDLFSTAFYRYKQPMKTTLQVFQHTGFTYARHLLKRRRWKTLASWLTSGSCIDLVKLAERNINRIEMQGGCFHLWGHSWEIDEYNLWHKAEELFKVLANRSEFNYVENGALAELACR